MALDFIGEVLVRVGFEVLGYGTGRVVIPALSFGTARGDKLSLRRYVKPYQLWWREDGQVVLSGEATAFVGMAFWIAAFVTMLVCIQLF